MRSRTKKLRGGGGQAYAGTGEVTVRFDPVGVSDADTLVRLARDFHAEDGHPLTKAGEAALRQIAHGEPFARAWLVREDDAALGYLILTLGFSVEYGGRDGFIDDLYLVPAARGRGFGRQVIDFALTQACELGIRTLHLEVETGNDAAARLYRAAGFTGTGRRLMRLRLSG
jgi:ribosomal protein S18 acetylase RimI-like enzyme